ncbi:MAG: hypothetical protein U0796_01940 [Gemmatales bacterium]
MSVFFRISTIAVLLSVAGFSLFGFLASYESPLFLVWRVAYAIVGLGSLAGITGLLWRWRQQSWSHQDSG